MFCGVFGGLVVDRNLNNNLPVFTVVLSVAGIFLAITFYKSQSNQTPDE